MEEKVWLYKPNIKKKLAGVLISAICIWFVVVQALGADRGLILFGLVSLAPKTAALFLWCLAVGGLVFFLLFFYDIYIALTTNHYVKLNTDELIAPKFSMSRALTTTAISSINALVVQRIRNERYLHIYSTTGRQAIFESMLPNSAAFDEIYDALERALSKKLVTPQ